MTEKAIGYTLLSIGILIMLASVVEVYLVFTGKQNAYPLFQTKSVSLDLGEMLPAFSEGQTLSKPQTPPLELIKGEDLNKSFNITVHFFLMSFIAGIGFKLSSLGTSLVRPIVVKAKEQKQSPQPVGQS